MKKKFCISFFVSFFSLGIYAQSENKKEDSLNPAREVILKNSGEKTLPQQLKEDQLKQQPAILNSDSLNTTKSNSKRIKCNKHFKKKRS